MSVPEYALIRNGMNFIMSGMELALKRKSPFEGLTREIVPVFAMRTIAGNV
jgi:hypothetical protein